MINLRFLIDVRKKETGREVDFMKKENESTKILVPLKQSPFKKRNQALNQQYFKRNQASEQKKSRNFL